MTERGDGPAYGEEYEAPWHKMGRDEHKGGSHDEEKKDSGGEGFIGEVGRRGN